MKNTIFTTLFLLAIAFGSYAQQATAPDKHDFTIQDCINYADQHLNTVVNSKLDIESADYRVKEIIGQGLPQVSGSAQFTDYLKIPTTLLPGEFFNAPGTFIPVKFGVTYQASLGVAASQILFDPNYIVGLQANKTYKELYQRSYTRTTIEASVNVTKAYYQVLVSDAQIKLIDADLTQLKQQVDETSARNKQGFAEKIDVDRITVSYNNLVTTRENTLRTLAINYQLLKFQMGMPVEQDLTLKDKLEDIKLDESALTDMSTDTTVYKNRIEYNLQETNIKLNEFTLKSVKGRFLPKLSAVANYTSSYQDNRFGNLFSASYPSAYVGLNLTVPIFTGFQHVNQYKQSKIDVLKSKNDLADLKNNLNLQANVARTGYMSGLRSLENQKQNQALAQEVLRVSKIKYQQGVGSSIEVTQAQAALQDADNQYIQGLYETLINKVNLDQAYGRIK